MTTTIIPKSIVFPTPRTEDEAAAHRYLTEKAMAEGVDAVFEALIVARFGGRILYPKANRPTRGFDFFNPKMDPNADVDITPVVEWSGKPCDDDELDERDLAERTLRVHGATPSLRRHIVSDLGGRIRAAGPCPICGERMDYGNRVDEDDRYCDLTENGILCDSCLSKVPPTFAVARVSFEDGDLSI